MLEYLKELLEDIKLHKENDCEIGLNNLNQKKLALETAIEILEKLKNNGRIKNE